MPIEIRAALPSVCVRREAFERASLTRARVDERFALAADEFAVEGDLVVLGPLAGDSATELLVELEAAGLEYYDDYFELTGNWPAWLRVFAMHGR